MFLQPPALLALSLSTMYRCTHAMHIMSGTKLHTPALLCSTPPHLHAACPYASKFHTPMPLLMLLSFYASMLQPPMPQHDNIPHLHAPHLHAPMLHTSMPQCSTHLHASMLHTPMALRSTTPCLNAERHPCILCSLGRPPTGKNATERALTRLSGTADTPAYSLWSSSTSQGSCQCFRSVSVVPTTQGGLGWQRKNWVCWWGRWNELRACELGMGCMHGLHGFGFCTPNCGTNVK